MFNLPAYEQYENFGQSATSGLPTKFFTSLMRPGGTIGRRILWYTMSKNREYVPYLSILIGIAL